MEADHPKRFRRIYFKRVDQSRIATSNANKLSRSIDLDDTCDTPVSCAGWNDIGTGVRGRAQRVYEPVGRCTLCIQTEDFEFPRAFYVCRPLH
eukprot:1176080-Prorocentrum_minimum.AAC.4